MDIDTADHPYIASYHCRLDAAQYPNIIHNASNVHIKHRIKYMNMTKN